MLLTEIRAYVLLIFPSEAARSRWITLVPGLIAKRRAFPLALMRLDSDGWKVLPDTIDGANTLHGFRFAEAALSLPNVGINRV
jgi:hypothetical protein